jgi:hypothetical protein
MVKQANLVKLSTAKDMLRKADVSIRAVLFGVPFIELLDSRTEARIGDKDIDLLLNAMVSGKPVKFLVEAKSQGEPRLVRIAVSQLKDYLRDAKDSYGIFVAPFLSDASRQICREAGVGCIDLAGNAFLSFRNIFVDISGKPNPFPVSRLSRSVFSPKSSRVLRALLADPSKRWYVEDLSRETGISIGLTSRVKQSLLSMEWIKEENKSFFLVKPEEALSQWVGNYSYEKNTAVSFYSGLAEDELEAAVVKECEKRGLRYGLALFSGARKVAPFVRFMRFFSYIEGNIEDVAEALQFKRVDTGANVTLLQPYDEGVFYGLQNMNGIKVVSDIQLYLDLKGYKGRGEEAAQAIFEKRIKPKW